jgi:hypothetical protein
MDDSSRHQNITNTDILPVPQATVKPSIHNDKWTDNIPLTNHVRFFLGVDWTSSLLGPLKSWSFALRLHVFTLMADTRASCIYW